MRLKMPRLRRMETRFRDALSSKVTACRFCATVLLRTGAKPQVCELARHRRLGRAGARASGRCRSRPRSSLRPACEPRRFRSLEFFSKLRPNSSRQVRSANQAPSNQPVGGARTRPTTTRVNVIASSSRRRCRVVGRRASPGTPGTGRCGLPAICRQRSIHRRRAGGSSNGARYPQSFRPAGCIGPRNGICAKSLSCLLVAGHLPSILLLSAKYLLFAAIPRTPCNNSRVRKIIAVATSFLQRYAPVKARPSPTSTRRQVNYNSGASHDVISFGNVASIDASDLAATNSEAGSRKGADDGVVDTLRARTPSTPCNESRITRG